LGVNSSAPSQQSRCHPNAVVNIPNRLTRWVFALLVIAAAVIRLVHLNGSLLSFHPTRQYRSAIIARACYYDARADVPEWARTVAAANRAMQPAGEPPVMEWLTCAAWHAIGDERLEIPHAIAVLAWMLGVIPLYLLATRVAPGSASVIAVALYLFLPYAIVASGAFQPDPLMTCCSLWALLALVRHAEDPRAHRMYVAAALIAIAALVKPMSVFLTLPVMASLAIAREGVLRAIADRRLWLLLALSVLPPGLYYGHSAMFGTLANDQMRLRFVPSLVATPFFWSGCWTMIQRVFTAPLFLGAVAGALLARSPLPRALLIGLFTGYALFAFAFTYHVPTHDYYHLPYTAAVALGLTQLFGMRRSHTWLVIAIAAAIAVGGVLEVSRRVDSGDPSRIARYEAIGELVQHDTRVVFLDGYYGYPLMYHGQISGDAWPTIDDLRAEAIDGRPVVDARTRIVRDYGRLQPRYFVVTDLESFDAQPDLQQFLDASAEVIQSTPTDRVFRFTQDGRR
jgi:4-amino-4-deoxy-L-arabinose transferase-like glycosyltransferase